MDDLSVRFHTPRKLIGRPERRRDTHTHTLQSVTSSYPLLATEWQSPVYLGDGNTDDVVEQFSHLFLTPIYTRSKKEKQCCKKYLNQC